MKHTERIVKLTLKISEGIEIDHDILIPAAILHDIARARVDRMETKKVDYTTLGSKMARAILN